MEYIINLRIEIKSIKKELENLKKELSNIKKILNKKERYSNNYSKSKKILFLINEDCVNLEIRNLKTQLKEKEKELKLELKNNV